ncbi:polyketide synthase [Vararia minispora EC-137]|uniref:Polyketide synthase n=1 Tax=Vararia minispora EC-137 TaxID=1314806 RepID=A0ACB8QY67_9AGAM|nr:polyketide synthase [Vararia minispora EC-137]
MPAFADIPIFPGQGSARANTSATLERTLRIASSPYGRLILSSCFSAFHAELDSLSPTERSEAGINLTDFDAPGSLLNALHGPYPINPILSSTRLVLIQTLTYFNAYAEELTNATPERSSTHEFGVLGFSSGIISACVAGASRSTLHYINNATAAFRLAFWIGFRAQAYRHRVLDEAGIPRSDTRPWSLVFTGVDKVTAEKLVDDHNSRVSSGTLEPSLTLTAIVDESTITISGRPDKLASFAAQMPASIAVGKTSVDTFYHSSHLAGVRDDVIADVSRRGIRFPTHSDLSAPIISTLTGQSLSEAELSGRTLVEAVLDLILIQPVNWDKVIQSVVSTAGALRGVVRLVGVGPGSGLVRSIERAFPQGRAALLDLTAVRKEDMTMDTKPVREPIAIVGMAVNMPGAPDTRRLWAVLEEGLNTISEIPEHRFNVSRFTDPSSSKSGRSMKAHTGNFIDDPDGFDAKFFKISPREARSMDPQARVLLHTAYEALEDSGYVPGATPSFASETFGCYVGVATGDYVQNLRDDIDVYYSTGTLRAFLSGRISYAMKLSGPSVVLDTACSSSLVAIYQACRALTNHDCNAALAGGVNVITSPDMFLGLDRGHFLSPTGQCKAFDASADGYSRSEGCGLFVLKRLSDALAENDHVLGVIRGVEVNQSGLAHSITHPHAPTQASLFRQLLSRSGVEAHRVSVVEAHGTGTQAGDPNELESIRAVFATGRSAENPLHVTSVKANIGHLEAASGAAALAKLLLMLKYGIIPRQISLKNLNPLIQPLHVDHTVINLENAAWTATIEGDTRLALLNNFGAAGSNGALLLEEHRQKAIDTRKSSQSSFVVGLSAKTEEALYRLRDSYVSWLQGPAATDVPLADIAYTATSRRIVYEHRLAVHVGSKEELVEKLNSAMGVNSGKDTRKIAFVFSGQGGQYKSMGSTLYHSHPLFKEIVDECHEFLTKSGFPGVLQVIVPEVAGDPKSQAEELEVYQPAVFALEYALAMVWMSWGVTPAVVIGHSLGEYAALVVAGVLSLKGALTLVANRVRFMVTKCAMDATGMIAVNLGSKAVQDILSSSPVFSDMSIACHNSPTDTVVSGPVDQLKSLKSHLDATMKCKSVLLPVPFGYHSRAMDPLLTDLVNTGRRVTLRPPNVPIVSNVLGEPVLPGAEGVFTPEYFARHCALPVQFEKGVASLVQSFAWSQKIDIWIEIGPHSTTLPMLKAHPSLSKESLFLPSLKKQQDPWTTLSAALAQIYTTQSAVSWRSVFAHLDARCTSLPTYPWSKTKYWVTFVEEGGAVSSSSSALSDGSTIVDTSSMLRSWAQFPSSENEFVAIFETPITQLAGPIRGHRVGDHPLCPASVYHELALAGTKVAVEHLKLTFENTYIALCDVDYDKPLVYGEDDLRVIRTAITISQDGTGAWSVSSRVDQGVEECHCRGTFKYQSIASVSTKFSRARPIVSRQIAVIRSAPGAETLSPRTAYEIIFPRVVHYSREYHTMQSLVIGPDGTEGYAVVQLPKDHHRGKFTIHPVFMDTMLHVAGFVANMQGDTDDAFICSKVDAVRAIPSLIDPDARYGVYINNAWVPEEKTTVAEAYALELGGQGRIVAHVKGMHFRKVRLGSLKRSLAMASKKSAPQAQSQTRSPPSNPPVAPQVPSNLEEQVRRIIAETCDTSLSSIHLSTELEVCGIDSLMSIEIFGKLEKAFPRVELDPTSLSACKTVADIVKAVTARSPADTPPAPPAPLSSARIPAGSAPVGVTDVRGLLAAVLGVPVSELTDEADFEALGLDSLTAIEALAEIQKAFAIILPQDVFESAKNVKGLQACITGCLTRHGHADDDAHARYRASIAKALRLGESPILFQSSNTSRAPLFLIHDGSGLVSYLKLVSPLGRALWGFSNPRFLDVQGWGSLRQMAEMYAGRLLEVVGKVTPLVLGGWSFGGVVAFEAARRLIAKDVHVLGVLLIDSPCPTNHVPLTATIIDEVTRLGGRKANDDLGQFVARQFEANASMLGVYGQGQLKGPFPKVVLLRSRDGFRPAGVDDIPTWLADRSDPHVGVEEWERLVEDKIKVIDIPGHHFTPFHPENVSSVSDAIVEGCSYLDERL